MSSRTVVCLTVGLIDVIGFADDQYKENAKTAKFDQIWPASPPLNLVTPVIVSTVIASSEIVSSVIESIVRAFSVGSIVKRRGPLDLLCRLPYGGQRINVVEQCRTDLQQE